MISRFLRRGVAALSLAFAFVSVFVPIARAATFGVTVPAQNTLSNRFLPYATSGTQLGGNSPAYRDSATVLGIPTFLEGYETLTPAGSVTLNWLTGRTKGITLNQNTTFAFSNVPSGSTNIQTMILQVIGDGVSSVAFTGVSWQTPQVPVPDSGVITLYFLRARASSLVGYVGLGGGSGGALWNSLAGVLYPDPQVDEVSIVSDAASTGSNILLNLDTDSGWVDGESLVRVASGGVVKFRIDADSGWTGTGVNVLLDNGKVGSVTAVGQQVFSGFYGGGLPTDTPTTSAAWAYDKDPPNTSYQWDSDNSTWY
jgi:hypothetical protein